MGIRLHSRQKHLKEFARVVAFEGRVMKTFGTHLANLMHNEEIKRNLPTLMKFVALIAAVVVLFTILFHFIMLYEGQNHSWISGLYWVMVVMSTLGFGDITFQTDVGRLFSVVVLLAGVILLLTVLPFAFIRFLYAPWLEEQMRLRVPRKVHDDMEGHVVITARDAIAPGLVLRLQRDRIPYVLIEPDPTQAGFAHTDGLKVVVGDFDNAETYRNVRADKALLVLANHNDILNTNIALTVREAAPKVPIAAISTDENAIDILTLAGVNHVLPLKRWLGEQLANRVNTQQAGLHRIGRYHSLVIAELPVHNTPFAGKTIRNTRLREETGVSIIGVWESGVLAPASPEVLLTNTSVAVVMGRQAELSTLDQGLSAYDNNPNPVLIIGGGSVGMSAAQALADKKVPFNLLEKSAVTCELLNGICNKVVIGDASDLRNLKAAGIETAPSVLITTNDDSINIYLTAYCRRLNPETRIVSRITHERNLDSIYRAGADFVLSYATLALDAISSILSGKELVVLGEGVDLFSRRVPSSLVGKSLAQSGIGAMTGLTVVAIRQNDDVITMFTPSMEIVQNMELVMIGSHEQMEEFVQTFERNK